MIMSDDYKERNRSLTIFCGEEVTTLTCKLGDLGLMLCWAIT